MEKHPGISFIGGLVMFLGAASIGILDALRRLDFLQKMHPTIYAGITSPPNMVIVGLAGVVAMLYGGGQFHQDRLTRTVEQNEPPPTPPLQPIETTRQEIYDSPVGGDLRMAGRDYNETHVHANPLLQARLAEFDQIDAFLVRKSENQLRDTFDFPDMLKFNIRLAKNFYWPGIVPPREMQEMNEFFKDGSGMMYKPFLDTHTVGNSLYMKGKPGKLYVANASKKCVEARSLLMSLSSSSKLPLPVATALKDFDKTVQADIEMFVISLSECFALNQRSLRETDDASGIHIAVWNYYWNKFIHLKPRADAIGVAIRSILESTQ